jgi:hypothetical protein
MNGFRVSFLAKTPVYHAQPRYRVAGGDNRKRDIGSYVTFKMVDGSLESSMPLCQAPRIPDILLNGPANDNYKPTLQSMKPFEVEGTTFVKNYTKSSTLSLIITAPLCIAVIGFFVLRLAM